MDLRPVLAAFLAVLLTSACGSSAAAPLGDADGFIPDNGSVSPFDTSVTAIRNLDPALLAAVRQAARDAQRHGITVQVTSGWRSKAYQQQLLDDAVRKYGSLAKARESVNTPEKSTHVTGKAVDLGPTDADDWIGRHGTDYGLCQVYSNEMWHFELLTAPGGQCPPQLPNAAG
ncbi:M15 family metallopeptidase [Kutzneria sp. CA-103260]|uniref:M15 family metallopeptidase n=1 Tax=Kutzneria sp. CA-103260 TaxID=2802641 RepID=UPI001BAD5FF2|nr:M15 family metallopeptidase [Kutzneria sp. CA-103260]QUQ66081.1 D-alanyl-D-alanine carboxypeptidase [Kutzneria sp. CA-103260]